MALERLQRVLAKAGLAARRKAEVLITAGRVRVDGVVVTELGVKVDARRQRVEVDGRRIQADPACYGVLHKPRGMVTTVSDPEGRPTAQDILAEVGVRVVPIGRLDFNTSGVLLFTNDGDFAQALAHARTSVPKVYAAMVQKYVTEEDLELFRESIDIDGKKTRPAEVRILRREGDKTWLEITLREGKNRQVRRLGEHAGIQVVRLSRLSHAGIDAQGLKPGKWRFLSSAELKELKQQYGVPQKIHETSGLPPATTARRGSTFDSAARGSSRETGPRGRGDRGERRERPAPSGRPAGSSRGAGPGRGAGPARDDRPSRSAGSSRKAAPARGAGPAREARPSRGADAHRSAGPSRSAGPTREARPGRGAGPPRDDAPSRSAGPPRQAAKGPGFRPSRSQVVAAKSRRK